MPVPVHEVGHLRQSHRLALEGLRLLRVRLVGVGEDLVELGADELALLEERARHRVDRVLLLAHEPLRLLEEHLEESVREHEDLRRDAHRRWREREQRRAHPEVADIRHRSVGGVPQVGGGIRRLRVQDELLDGA